MLPSPHRILERESTGALGREDSFPMVPLPNAPPLPTLPLPNAPTPPMFLLESNKRVMEASLMLHF